MAKCGAANAGGGFIFICILEKDHIRSHFPVQISVNQVQMKEEEDK